MNLNDRALLVQLNISQWTARKHDKRATREVAASNNASMDAGRYNKSLLPMNDALDHVHKKSTHIRTKYYENTTSCGLDGMQILPSGNYLAFMTEFRKEKSEWYSLVSTFVDNYEQLVTHDRHRLQRTLGSLYDPADYPTVDQIRDKFRMDVAVFPVPSSANLRIPVSSAELDAIRQEIEQRVDNAAKTAMSELWQRLHDRVRHMAEKLADPKAIFRDSMVENARELCALLPRLNFTDDPHLEDMRQQVEQSLLKHPDALRNDPDLRRDTAAEAKAIMDKMAIFMGAK
jgi:hypothetical protein